jgi:signal transduction histidine kinase
MALGLLVYLRARRNRVNIAFLAFVISITAWSLTNFSTDNIHNFVISLWSARFANFFAILSIALYWVFIGYFARNKPAKSAKTKLAIFVPAMVISLTQLGVIRIASFTSAANEILGYGYAFIIINLIFGFVIVLRDMVLGLQSSKVPMLKNSIRIMLYGNIITFVFALITNILLPIFLTSWSVSRLGPIFTLFLIGTTTYAIVRHKLFDIRFFVIRAAVYLMSLFIMTLLLIVPIIFILDYLLNIHPNFGEFVLVLFVSVCLLYVLQYIRTVFDNVTSRIFFRYYYDIQEVLDNISNILVRTADLKSLRSDTAIVIKNALKTEHVNYVLFVDKSDQDLEIIRQLAEHKFSGMKNVIDIDEIKVEGKSNNITQNNIAISLAVKLRTTEGNLGFMLLGHKKSGDIYNTRDKRMLSTAADEIAISMQNALRFEQIQRFNVTLQQKIDDATHKLRDTNKRLKILDETKDDFISMASHQLRTPLTSVKGYLSLVIDGDAGKISDSQRKLLTQAFFSSQRMVYLIADLLNVSRLKTGKFVIERTQVNLADVIEQELAQLTDTAKGRDLTLSYQKPEQFPTLNIDETKTRQVIMNFVDNAIYYTPAGGHINVMLNETDKAIELLVKDDGIGVPAADQHHLFSKFYRAKNAQKARPDGTGLGLFMAKKVIVAQGGAIIFNSKEGKGSTFGFTFPKSLSDNANRESENTKKPDSDKKHALN